MSTATLVRSVEVDAPPLRDAIIEAPPVSTRHDAVVDAHHSKPSATDTVAEVCAIDIGGPAYVVGSVVGVFALAVGGVVALASEWRKQRNYRAQPGC